MLSACIYTKSRLLAWNMSQRYAFAKRQQAIFVLLTDKLLRLDKCMCPDRWLRWTYASETYYSGAMLP